MNILQQLLEGITGGGAKGPTNKTADVPAKYQMKNSMQQITQIPVGQALTPENIAGLPANVQPLAQIYNANPQDPRVAGVDPAMFGYAPDQAQAIRPFNPVYPADQSGAADQFSQGFAPIKVTRR